MESMNQSVINPAGFWIRFVASILDTLVISVSLGIIGYLVMGNTAEDIATNLSVNLLSLLYYLLVPVFWYGYTIGKRMFGIRIVKINGEKLGIGAMLMRVIVAGIIYLVTLGFGLIASAFMVGLRKDKRAIHDLIAGTYVTYEKP
jgi:uncharacterized RDD family membrane protein YckC